MSDGRHSSSFTSTTFLIHTYIKNEVQTNIKSATPGYIQLLMYIQDINTFLLSAFLNVSPSLPT